MRGRIIIAATALAAPWLPGCSDDPIGIPVPDEPSEATIADFRNAPVVEPSAFSLILLDVVRTDQLSRWDFVFAFDDDGTAELFPRAAVLDEPAAFSSGLQVVNTTFEGLTEAPESGYVTDEPVPVQVGDVLAVVSEPECGSFNFRRFGKLEILEIEPVRGTLAFKYLANPNCENRSLIPGEVGSN